MLALPVAQDITDALPSTSATNRQGGGDSAVVADVAGSSAGWRPEELVVEDEERMDDGAVALHPKTMQRLKLRSGDTVLIKVWRGLWTHEPASTGSRQGAYHVAKCEVKCGCCCMV